MSFVKLLENMAGVMSMKTHLKCVLGCSVKLDLGFLLIDEICHDVHKWSGSTLSSISCQTFTLSLANSNRVELCPNLWWNNYREILFFWVFFVISTFILFYQKCMFSLYNTWYSNRVLFVITKETMQKNLWKRRLCPKLTNATIENNRFA